MAHCAHIIRTTGDSICIAADVSEIEALRLAQLRSKNPGVLKAYTSSNRHLDPERFFRGGIETDVRGNPLSTQH